MVKDCTTNPSTHGSPVGFYDPVPALWIQDELHLVREELGVFASQYQSMVSELAMSAGYEPSKVIAATATIEQFEDQLTQVYGRVPRMFPTGGPTLERNFLQRAHRRRPSRLCRGPARRRRYGQGRRGGRDHGVLRRTGAQADGRPVGPDQRARRRGQSTATRQQRGRTSWITRLGWRT